jgi:branched-chain amino acid transport system permease protein
METSMSSIIRNHIGYILRLGLIGGAVTIYLSLVGLVGTFGDRAVVVGLISIGHTFLFLAIIGIAFMAARRTREAPKVVSILAGALSGLIAGLLLAIFVLVATNLDLRSVFLNATPALYLLLTWEQGVNGVWIPVVGGTVVGAFSAVAFHLPSNIRKPLIWGLIAMLMMGLFAGLLRIQMVSQPGAIANLGRFLFAPQGLTFNGSIITFIFVAGSIMLWSWKHDAVEQRIDQLPETGRMTLRWSFIILMAVIILIIPQVSGPFISLVIVRVGLYTLMALGLNLELGFAGLLDLGFVAFFAIGGYTIGVLTSLGQYGLLNLSWWQAVPIAVLMALLAGILLGVPVLGIRGDYLAIATLGFGEITRILVLSDFMRPLLGGSQGILQIPKPDLLGFTFTGPTQIYYLVVVAALLVAFVAWRLRDSRTGRTWMAIREDEDVAEALGIKLVTAKLLAYGLGAAFAGLSGAIFAILVGSIFPHDMQLLVSIYVVSVIVVGGMGSIPGVAVGALVLIGLPELFREFEAYRLLFYGAALIAMMLFKPEGLWPSTTIQRELQVEEEIQAAPVGDVEQVTS